MSGAIGTGVLVRVAPNEFVLWPIVLLRVRESSTRGSVGTWIGRVVVNATKPVSLTSAMGPMLVVLVVVVPIMFSSVALCKHAKPALTAICCLLSRHGLAEAVLIVLVEGLGPVVEVAVIRSDNVGLRTVVVVSIAVGAFAPMVGVVVELML